LGRGAGPDRHGPLAVAFTLSSPSTTEIADSSFIRQLANALGTPDTAITPDVCGWGRGFATRYTYRVGNVAVGSGGAMPDIVNTARSATKPGSHGHLHRVRHA
jgi:hypothetical protein